LLSGGDRSGGTPLAKDAEMTVKAIYRNGVFRPQEPVDLEEETEVVVVIPSRGRADVADPTGWKAVEALIGFIDDAPPDMAEHHDRHLYGTRDR
jgi:predicted DNA-binding antitoxin AbrB/MazE fold protein